MVRILLWMEGVQFCNSVYYDRSKAMSNMSFRKILYYLLEHQLQPIMKAQKNVIDGRRSTL